MSVDAFSFFMGSCIALHEEKKGEETTMISLYTHLTRLLHCSNYKLPIEVVRILDI